MDKVKSGLRGLNPLEKATRAAIVYSQMNGNPHFPNPVPSMADFHAAYIELKEANLAALDRGLRAIQRRNRAVEVMDAYLSGMAGYVNGVCLGDTSMLITSGFKLIKRAEPISSLIQPRQITVRATVFPGQLKVRWQRVPGAVIYQLEQLLTNEAGEEHWERVALTTSTHFVIGGMPSHVPQTFRVCAVGTKTQSPYSQSQFGKAI